ncbi:MAG TPA: GIY-YIG nuclease family protein [Chitinophagaceae bacterium]|nr:GIY-YIG nuclease family protein [Chitinophagaceae bacterium]
MSTVYIIFSQTTQKYYTGQTQDFDNRLLENNSGETPSINHGIPWKLVWFAQVESRKEAMILEKKIKNQGAMRFIESMHN